MSGGMSTAVVVISAVVVSTLALPQDPAQSTKQSKDELCENTALVQVKSHVLGRQPPVGRKVMHPVFALDLVYPLPPECGKLVCDNSTYEECHTHGSDFALPAKQVLQKHPGVDATCFFNPVLNLADLGQTHYPAGALVAVLREREKDKFLGVGKGANTTYRLEGKSLKAKLDDPFRYPVNDLMAYSLGFLQGQGLDTSLMGSNHAWESLASDQCFKVMVDFDLTEEDVSMNQILDHMAMLEASAACTVEPQIASLDRGSCKEVTKKDFAKFYHYMCMLGLKSAASTMAFLHARACLLEDGNRIGHLIQCA
jgi:hypothetical protein